MLTGSQGNASFMWLLLLMFLLSGLGCAQGAEIEQTLAIIKPDAYAKSSPQQVMQAISERGFDIVMTSEGTLYPAMVSEFYKEHKQRSFFGELVKFMSSGPSMVMILEKADAIKSWRAAMGPTDSNEARRSDPNSLRAIFGTDKTRNALHGSDSRESAAREIALFFPEMHQKRMGLTMASLDGLTKDEIFEKIVTTAAEMAVDVDEIVDHLNNEQAASLSVPQSDRDHSEL